MPTPQSFTFLSWNLCLMENSFMAPANWRMDQTESKIREFILAQAPDFVFFQELPGLIPYVETHDMIPANTTSHSGNIATLVRNELKDGLQSRAMGNFAVMSTIPSANLTFANVHLAPGKNGAAKRLATLGRIVEQCPTPSLVIAGDTNSRIEEEPLFANLGLDGKRPPEPTWDTKTNRFRENGRAFTSFFTRFFHNDRAAVSEVQVWSQPTTCDGRKFHLSDHFALSGRATTKT